MSSVIFYTQPTLYNSTIVQTVGNIESGYSVQALLDRNLDTIWKAGDKTSQQGFIIDLYPQDEGAYLAGRGKVYPDATGSPPYYATSGSSGDFDTIGFWLNNYQEASTTVTSLAIYNKRTAGEAIGGDNLALGGNWTNTGKNGLFFVDTNGEPTRRFIDVRWTPFANQPLLEVAAIFICKKHTIPTAPKWPQKIIPRYYNKVTKMRGGRDSIVAEAGNSVFEFTQNFSILNDAHEAQFVQVFDDCRGQLLPLIYQPGTAILDAYVCRLAQDTLKREQTFQSYFKDAMKFKTIAYKRSGDQF